MCEVHTNTLIAPTITSVTVDGLIYEPYWQSNPYFLRHESNNDPITFLSFYVDK